MEKYRWIVTAALILLLGWVCQLNVRAYFTHYRTSLPHQNYPFHRVMAEVVDDFAGVGPVYIKYVPYWVDGDVVRLQLRRQPPGWNNVVPAVPFDQIHLAPQERLLVILHPDDGEALAELKAHYPHHVVVPHQDAHGDIVFLKFIGQAGSD